MKLWIAGRPPLQPYMDFDPIGLTLTAKPVGGDADAAPPAGRAAGSPVEMDE